MKLLKSLEELLYELVSWLVFYPLTMWRSVSRPLQMMRYADAELQDESENQYDDTLSPPLFLLITLLIAQGLSTVIPSIYDPLTPKALSSGSNLLIARGVIYGVFPLVMAVTLLRGKSIKLTRDTLRPPFFSQCYVVAPFALAVGLGLDLILIPGGQGLVEGGVVFAVAVIWYSQAEIRWFKHDLDVRTLRALALFIRGFLIALIANLGLAIVIGWGLKTWSP